MTTVWFFSDDNPEWRTTPGWSGRTYKKAKEISDRYNRKYEGRYYWASEHRPTQNQKQQLKEADQ